MDNDQLHKYKVHQVSVISLFHGRYKVQVLLMKTKQEATCRFGKKQSIVAKSNKKK